MIFTLNAVLSLLVIIVSMAQLLGLRSGVKPHHSVEYEGFVDPRFWIFRDPVSST